MKKHILLMIILCAFLITGIVALHPAEAADVDSFAPVIGELGKEAAIKNPEEPLTAKELVLLASRYHNIANGLNESIPDTWSFEKLCNRYALPNGIIIEGQFESEDEPVSRADVAYVLGRIVNLDELESINSVLAMPDSNPGSLYYEPAIKLVNAGVMDGRDKYASFVPTAPVLRYEMSDIFDRIANKELRIKKDYIEYASDEPFYLIDDFLMGDTSPVRGIYSIASGWKHDYTGSTEKYIEATNSDNARGAYVNTLRDLSTSDHVMISREIFPQKNGELVLEANFNITFGFAGLKLRLEDIDGKQIFEMRTEGKKKSPYFYFASNGKTYSRYISTSNLYVNKDRVDDNVNKQYKLNSQIAARLTINLNEGTVKAYISGYNCGTYKLESGYNGLKKIIFVTDDNQQIEATIKQVHLYKNYKVNDMFISHKVNVKPYDYTISGDVTVKELISTADNQGDFYSVQMNAKKGSSIYAYKYFSETSGVVKLESYLIIPEGNDGVYFSANYSSSPIIRIVTKDQKFYTVNKNGEPDKELRDFTPNTWQCIRIEADTNKQTALIKIDGKIVAENVPFLVKADKFNRIELGCQNPDSDFTFWFDDVEVHELFEHDDYVPEPVPLDTGNYLLSMSVCNLWRNGSHYGWAYIEPHQDIMPITGYYDEGSAEAMDWEIKFLSEHGVSTYAMCWYSPTAATVPIKKPRMIDAHHEGYFNAKYTEYLDFSIMWENANFSSPGLKENFKNNIFPFWMEWYFSDPRYFRIKEDGKEYIFLTIYQWANFRNMCLPANFKDSDYNMDIPEQKLALINKYNEAEAAAADLISWMEQQVIDAGYADGIILCFTNPGSANSGNISMLNMAGSDTAIFPYAWGNTAYNVDTQKRMIEDNYALAQTAWNSIVTSQTGAYKETEKGLDLLALAAVGFNDIGWAQRRFPLISDTDFEQLLYWFKNEYMPRYKNDEDSWKQYFIQFDTWNEYGEGHYIYPTAGLEAIPGTDYKGYGGYGYLESMAKVFGKNYDKELHEALDIIPTEQQKSRIGHLYVGGDTFIRREFLPGNDEGSYKDAPIPEAVTKGIKFDTESSLSKISSPHVTGFLLVDNKKYRFNKNEKAIELLTAPVDPDDKTKTNPDPIIGFPETSIFNGVSTSECDVFHVRMKTSIPGSYTQLFFRVDTMPKEWDKNLNQYVVRGYHEDYQYTFNIGTANEWHDYYIDLKTHPDFTGNIVSLRLDTGNIAYNTILISEIELLKFSDVQRRTAITIDSRAYNPTDFWEIQDQSRNEIYIAPADDNFLYKKLHIYYEWNEKTGRLFLDTPNETTFEFTMGSDKVLVNGKEQKLPRKAYVYDGAPVIPLLYILNNAGYTYVHDFDKKTLDITVSDQVTYEDIPNANAENPNITNTFFSQDGSNISIITDSKYELNNVWYIGGNDNANTSICADIDFIPGMEYTVSFDIMLDSFANTNKKLTSVPLYMNAVYSDGTENTSHEQNIGNIKYNKWVHIEKAIVISEDKTIDEAVREAICIYVKPEDFFEGAMRGANICIDNFRVRRLPDTFQLLNGDFEDENMDMWYASNSFITRVDDGTGNHYVEVVNDINSSSGWTYLRQKTKFEPGVTYYYSFDFKMGKNTYGTETKSSFAINPRYVDLLQEHLTSNTYDHPTTFNKLLIGESDGWKHFNGSFTISMGHTNSGVNGGYDEITFFANPANINGKNYGMTFYMDNIKFSTTPLD